MTILSKEELSLCPRQKRCKANQRRNTTLMSEWGHLFLPLALDFGLGLCQYSYISMRTC